MEKRQSKKHFRRVLQKDPCSYCGWDFTPGPSGTADHITPKSVLTSECDWDNFAGACRYCNNKKADKPVMRYLWEKWALPQLLSLDADSGIDNTVVVMVAS